jgi:hypothetical protein
MILLCYLLRAGTLRNGSDMTAVGYGEVSSPPGQDPVNRNRRYVSTHYEGINDFTIQFGYGGQPTSFYSGVPCEGGAEFWEGGGGGTMIGVRV